MSGSPSKDNMAVLITGKYIRQKCPKLNASKRNGSQEQKQLNTAQNKLYQ